MVGQHMVFYSTSIMITNYSCKCRCVLMWKKNVKVVNEIIGFGGLNYFSWLSWMNKYLNA